MICNGGDALFWRASNEAMTASRFVERGVREQVHEVGDNFRIQGCLGLVSEGAVLGLHLWCVWVEGGGLSRLAASRVR